ncbi:MAG: WYL domain-containing protein [Candidatus Omnitrophica bacterium]|nr:WYL domain-containing protein [Candidatus Omnitrophota bacterium]
MALPKKGSYDKKFFRLLFILNKLDRGERVSTRFLAKEFNVSIRTIQRDMDLLNGTGFLITSIDKGTYFFEQGFSLRKIQLSGEEASLLSFMYEITLSLGSNFEGIFKKVLSKVIQNEQSYPYYAKIPHSLASSGKLPFIKELEGAVSDNCKINIKYKKDETTKEYCLWPLKIIFFDGFWYLLAQTGKGKNICKFRLDRIEDVEVLNGYFTPPENIKTMLDESVNIWFSEKKKNKATVHIDSDIADYFKQREYFPSQKIVKKNKDGSLIIETRYSDPEEVSHTIIMHWVPHIKVTAPQALKDTIKAKINQYLRQI